MSQTPKNKSVADLHKAVGSAISNWARIELQLHILFATCLSFTPRQAGGGFSIGSPVPFAVLDAIDGFRGKLLMIDAALTRALKDLDREAAAILNDWAVERKKVNKLHRNRSILAHWTAARLLTYAGQTDRVVLESPYPEGGGKTTIQETDVETWEKEFISAANRLAQLANRLAGHQGLQHKFLEQVANQVLNCFPADPKPLEYLKQRLSDYR